MVACILMALLSMSAQAKQETIWNNIIIGYTNVYRSEITKVGFYADRTEVDLHVNYPKGAWVSISKHTYIDVDGKHYLIKDATKTGLENQYTLPTDNLDFTLVFEPVPQGTRVFDVVEPGGWTYSNIRSSNDVPVGITDTYWRNDATGEWIIGFAPKHVIYNNKVWGLVTFPSFFTVKCRWGPVERPVLPLTAIGSPAHTVSPRFTYFFER